MSDPAKHQCCFKSGIILTCEGALKREPRHLLLLLSLAGLLNIYPQRGAQGAGEVSEKTSYHSLPKPRSFQLEVFVQFYVFFFVFVSPFWEPCGEGFGAPLLLIRAE